MSDFVTPPGMPPGWTPPATDVVVEPHVDVPIGQVLEACYAQCYVRDQNTEELDSVLDKLKSIWEEFEAKKIDSHEFSIKIGNWRNTVYQNCSADQPTREIWESAVTAMLRESNK